MKGSLHSSALLSSNSPLEEKGQGTSVGISNPIGCNGAGKATSFPSTVLKRHPAGLYSLHFAAAAAVEAEKRHASVSAIAGTLQRCKAFREWFSLLPLLPVFTMRPVATPDAIRGVRRRRRPSAGMKQHKSSTTRTVDACAVETEGDCT